MRRRAVAALLWLAAAAAAAQAPRLKSGLELETLDGAVRPQDDLYRHVNGRWLDSTEIPPDRVMYSTFIELQDRVERELRDVIVEVAARPNRRNGSTAQQIADLYTSLMDEALAERLGAAPLRAELQRIEAIRTTGDLAAEAGYLSAIAEGGPFTGVARRNPSDRTTPIVQVSQGGTLLPERDDYLQHDAPAVEIRARYEAYLATLFTLTGRADARGSARAVLALETELARAQRPQAGGDRAASRYTLAELRRAMPGFDWRAWAKPQRIDRAEALVLSQPSFFERFAELTQATPLETWKAWLAARYITACAPFLSDAFSEARFDFFGRVLSGQELPRTRWKRAVSLVSGYLGDAVGRVYVERRFSAGARERARRLAANVVEAQRRALREAGWMSAATRREALHKLSRLRLRIGYPERWRDYSGLVIRAGDLLGNIERAKRFESELQMARLAEPASHDEWPITPQTVNAAYEAGANQIVLPAALLQPPLFDVEAEDAVNYGAIGAVIGHEILHAFDARGRRIDGDGAERSWWTPKDEQELVRRARRLADQLVAARADAERTLAEDAGDLGGLAVAFAAYRLSLEGRASPVIDGLSGEQRLFVSWARTWRSKVRQEYLRQWLLQAPHAPPQHRVNGPVSNVDGFYEAFAVRPGDRLYRAPGERVNLW